MQILPYIAVYFVLWWLTLFAVLPFGMKTQSEAEEVVLGTVASAPARFSGRRTFLMTTLVSAIIYFAWYILSEKFGYNIDSIPQFVPNFD
jgi:predicted secreted protein